MDVYITTKATMMDCLKIIKKNCTETECKRCSLQHMCCDVFNIIPSEWEAVDEI